MPKKREWLKKAREESGLTQKQAVYMVNGTLKEIYGKSAMTISVSAYAQYEGGYKNPTPPVAMAIAKILGFEWTLFHADVINKFKKGA